MPTVAARKDGEIIALASGETEEEATKTLREMVRQMWLADALREFVGK